MKKLYIICGVLSLLIAACTVFLVIQPKYFPLDGEAAPVHRGEIITYGDPGMDPEVEELTDMPATGDPDSGESETAAESGNEAPDVSDVPAAPETDKTVPVTDAPATLPTETKAAETEIQTTAAPPVLQDCFSKLAAAMKKNPDVYAWIRIPGTVIDYAVAQNPKNDSYYLNHGADGKYWAGGAVMSEHAYNSTDFSDPVTVLYAHCMKSGAMFGQLQSYYSDRKSFDKHIKIEIYTPGKKIEYTVFAAVPYDKRHILASYDFSNPFVFADFFGSMKTLRAFNAVTDANSFPSDEDRILILSTCLMGDNTHRYLVMAKCK